MAYMKYKDIEINIDEVVENGSSDPRVRVFKQGDIIDKTLFEGAVCRDVGGEIQETEDGVVVNSGYVILVFEYAE